MSYIKWGRFTNSRRLYTAPCGIRDKLLLGDALRLGDFEGDFDFNNVGTKVKVIKVGFVFPMVVICILPQAEFGRNYHREDAPHFITEL